MHADVRFTFLLSSLLSLLSLSNAFYIPGYSIKSYRDGETIPLFWNKLFSDRTQLQYAFAQLPFICPPSGRKRLSGLTSGTSLTLNLGEVLRGDRITVSDYDLKVGEDQEMRYLCSQEVDAAGLRWARQLIADGYEAEWIVDNLPGATSFVTTDKTRKYYAAGFKLGYEDVDPAEAMVDPKFYINNHVTLVIRYHRAPGRDGEQGKKVVVGFEVYPKSIEAGHRDPDTGLPADLNNVELGMELSLRANASYISGNETYTNALEAGLSDVDGNEGNGKLTIPYTYSVYWREDEHLEWGRRWDMYFADEEGNTTIHWLAIVNSLVISGLLTAVVAVIFARTIRGDIKLYNRDPGLETGKKMRKAKLRSPRRSTEKTGTGLLDQLDADAILDPDASASSDDESPEEITGWKLVHGDVFRPPPYGSILAPIVGSGTQVIFMVSGLIALSCLGILNPSFRGGFISVGMALFVLAGVFAGYFSGRVYRTFGGVHWRQNVLVTGTLIPGLIFATVFVLNFFVWAQASSTAIPFGTLLALAALWLLIQLPLVYVGSWYGFVMVGAWEHPVKPNAVARQVPRQEWYVSGWRTVLLAGLVPFAVVFIDLLFVFKSLWQDKSGYYYVFGFLAVVCGILVVTVIEVSVVATYVQLCSENHHWWWQSFLVGGASSLWIFAYCAWYYTFKLHITGFVSGILFFAYSFLACLVYGLLTGTVGFLASYAFVRRIYSAVKVD